MRDIYHYTTSRIVQNRQFPSFILNIKSLLRPGIKPGPPSFRSDTLTTTLRYTTLQYSTEQNRTVQYSTVQYSTVQYSTVQYSTVRHGTVQYTTLHYTTRASCNEVLKYRNN